MALNLTVPCAVQGHFLFCLAKFVAHFADTGASDCQPLPQAIFNALAFNVDLAAASFALFAAGKSLASSFRTTQPARPAEAERQLVQDIASVLSGTLTEALIRSLDVCFTLFLATSIVGPYATIALAIASLFLSYAMHDSVAVAGASLLYGLFAVVVCPFLPPLMILAYPLIRLTVLRRPRVLCGRQLWSLGQYAFTLRLLFAFGYDRDLCYHIRDNGLLWAAWRRGAQNSKPTFRALGRPFQLLLQSNAFAHCGDDAVPCFDGEPWSNWAEIVNCKPARAFVARCADDVVKVRTLTHLTF